MLSRKIRALGAVSLFLTVHAGCREPGETPAHQAVVTGVVRIGGKTAREGEVVFQPTSLGGTATYRAPIAKDGSYRITTVAGDNFASVKGGKIKDDPIMATNQQLVPIEPGESVHDIDL